MKIIIDARFWGPKHTGLGIYTKNLVTHLIEIDKKNDYVLVVNEPLDIPLENNFASVLTNIKPYSFLEQLTYPFFLYSLRPDLIHFTSINVPVLYLGKYILTVHDLIKHVSKGIETTTKAPILYWIKYLSYLIVFNWSVNFSQKIIVPSNSVKKDLLDKSSVTANKIEVIYEAANLTKQTSGDFNKEIIKLPEKFAVYTGNAYPHKNLVTLIQAWKEVYSVTQTKLVLIGSRSVFTKRIEKVINDFNATAFITNLGFVSDSSLPQVYSKANIYVFPSKIEGFGLPGLDAMVYDLPVVCSDIPTLREVYGNSAHYFDPNSATDMSSKIIEVLKDQKLRNGLISNGKKQLLKYSWNIMAAQTLKLYESCIRLRSSQ